MSSDDEPEHQVDASSNRIFDPNSMVADFHKVTGRYTGAWTFTLNMILLAEGIQTKFVHHCRSEEHNRLPRAPGVKFTSAEDYVTFISTKEKVRFQRSFCDTDAALATHENPKSPSETKFGPSYGIPIDITVQWRCTLPTNATMPLFEENVDFTHKLIVRGWRLERALDRYMPGIKVSMLIPMPER